MRDISCLAVGTVHFTSAQVALIFLLCGFLLLSLTSVILCPCVLWFTRFFCLWEIMLYWCLGPNVIPEEISFLCQMSALWNLHISLWFYSENWLWDNDILLKTFSALRLYLQSSISNKHTTLLLLSKAAWVGENNFSFSFGSVSPAGQLLSFPL